VRSNPTETLGEPVVVISDIFPQIAEFVVVVHCHVCVLVVPEYFVPLAMMGWGSAAVVAEFVMMRFAPVCDTFHENPCPV
jgi:hypothetical protein